jgi:DNA-binding response OmpR family regulator
MAHAHPPHRLLIVDDVAASRETLESILYAPDYEFYLAASGHEGLAVASQVQPDLILLDVMMPDLDGYEVCRRLRALPELAETPVVLITALDDRTSLRLGLEAGADDIVGKPFDGAQLRARVAMILRLNRRRVLAAAQERLVRAVEAAARPLVVVEEAQMVYANPPARRVLSLAEPEEAAQIASGCIGPGIYALDSTPDGPGIRWEVVSEEAMPELSEAER